MKTIILSGGFGTRLSEKTAFLPKSLVEIGSKPVLWHIMSHYSLYDMNEFVIALGFLGEKIKEYFLNFYPLSHNLTIDLAQNQTQIHSGKIPHWKVHLIDTGLHTQTGGRIKRLKEWIRNETFMLTYGDGLSNVNIQNLIAFHKAHGKLATVTAVHPPPRFGGLELQDNQVIKFSEKPQKDWINGGFFVLEPEVLNYIEGDDTMWEKAPLEMLAEAGELMAYKHSGFWHPMDTLRDQKNLETLYQNGKPYWLSKEEGCVSILEK
jgi:glucose-1-phosphate cytidylyltransferase